MGAVLRKYKKAIAGLKEKKKDFNDLSEQRTEAEIILWTTQAEIADRDRAKNVEAMDIYETKEQKGIERLSYIHPGQVKNA